MGKVMVIGPVGAGKTSLIRALQKDDRRVDKTQCIDFADGAIDTPGEYAQIPRFYPALLVTAVEAALILVVQDATDCGMSLPPGFANLFPRPVVGVVTKIDDPRADRKRAEARLSETGVSSILFCVSAYSGEGLTDLRAYLTERGCKQ